MKKYIFYSSAASTAAKLISKHLKSFLEPTGFAFELEEIGKDGKIPARKSRNCLLLLTEREFKNNAYKNLRTILFRRNAKVQKTDNHLVLPFPSRPSARKTALMIAQHFEICQFASLYEDTLESLNAFEKYADLSRQELLNLKQVVEAQERLQEFVRAESMDKERIIKAHERVSDLSRVERLSYDRVLQAWEIFSELIRRELIDSRKESQARERTLTLSDTERKQSTETIQALDKALELSRTERLESENQVKAEENILEFNRLSHIEDDRYLDNISESDLEHLLKNEALWNRLESNEKTNLIAMVKALLKTLLRRKHGKVQGS